MKYYAVIKNSIIDRVTCDFPENEIDIREVGPEAVSLVGQSARVIDWTTQTIKPLSVRVAEGLESVLEGMMLDGETFRAMTRDELYNAGLMTAEEYNKLVRADREVRYLAESDKLFIDWQYDKELNLETAEASRKTWMDKKAEIKADLPLKVV